MKVPKADADFQFELAREALSAREIAPLLNVISNCFLNNNSVPVWAQKALINAISKAKTYQIKSWDEVFGRPLEKGKQLTAERRRLVLMEPIFKRVRGRHEAGESITKDLFESVGREFGVSGTVAADAKAIIIEAEIEVEIFNYAIKSIE